MALSFAGYSRHYLPFVSNNSLSSAAFSIAIVLLFTVINIRGVGEASIVQVVTTVVKMLPLIFLGISGIMFGEVREIPAINPNNNSMLQMIAALCLLIMFSFIGVESATLPADDTIDPKKTIPRASILGTFTAVFVYMLAMLGLMSIIPLAELQSSTAPFTDAAQVLMGNSGAILITIGALFTISGTLNVCIMMAGTIMLPGAKDGLFPKYFSAKNPKGTPVRALLFSSVLGIAFLLSSISESLLRSYEYLLIIATLSVLIVYLNTGLASIKLQWSDHKKDENLNILQLSIALKLLYFIH